MTPLIFSSRFLARYDVLGVLGEGGMGVVYRAHDRKLGRDVAIKVIKSPEATDLVRFRREARLMAAVRSAHVVAVLDVDEDGVIPYIVCELVRGETLVQRQASAPLSVTASLGVVADVAAALGAVHQHGVVHRDVKPENIFLTSEGQTKLSDFGLARECSSQTAITATGLIMGTPDFMAPEQVTGAQLTEATDQFSLGVVAFWLCAGSVPYPADSVLEAALCRLNKAAPAPSTVRSGVPVAIDSFVARLLDRDPGRRFPDMTAVEAAARDLVVQLETRQSEGPTSRPTSRRQPPLSIRQPALAKEPGVPGVRVVGVVALLALAGFTWWHPSSPAHTTKVAPSARPVPNPPPSASAAPTLTPAQIESLLFSTFKPVLRRIERRELALYRDVPRELTRLARSLRGSPELEQFKSVCRQALGSAVLSLSLRKRLYDLACDIRIFDRAIESYRISVKEKVLGGEEFLDPDFRAHHVEEELERLGPPDGEISSRQVKLAPIALVTGLPGQTYSEELDVLRLTAELTATADRALVDIPGDLPEGARLAVRARMPDVYEADLVWLLLTPVDEKGVSAGPQPLVQLLIHQGSRGAQTGSGHFSYYHFLPANYLPAGRYELRVAHELGADFMRMVGAPFIQAEGVDLLWWRGKTHGSPPIGSLPGSGAK